MAIKFIILCGLFAIALGFTLPEEQFDEPNNHYEVAPSEEAVLLVRNARSPQGRLEARGEHSSRHGESASVTYTHPISKNLEAYATASRNFKYNDNSGHVGLSYGF